MCHRTAEYIEYEVSRLTKLDAFSSNVFKCMDRMKKMFVQGGFTLDQFDCDAIVSPALSPVIVARIVSPALSPSF